ncbi:MAG: lamin tail domain-containing protein, partial [Thermoplasmata archaeon]|nr:lamin tail domain-containing protein [Thermoplasmata archaeon]
GSTVKVYDEDGLGFTVTISSSVSKVSLTAGVWGGMFLDWVEINNLRTRKYTSSEPTTAFGSEQPKGMDVVVINEVMYKPSGSNEEWVELYNSGSESVNIDGWEITDEDDGNRYAIPDIPDFPSHNYVVIHYTTGTDETSFGQSQSSALHLYTGSSGIYTDTDQCSLYTGSTHDSTTIVDFVAWGGDPYADDCSAVGAGIWDDGDFVNTGAGGLDIQAGDSIGRDLSSTDTNQPADWHKDGGNGSPTPGQQNTPEFSDVYIPIIAIVALFVVFRKKRRKDYREKSTQHNL